MQFVRYERNSEVTCGKRVYHRHNRDNNSINVISLSRNHMKGMVSVRKLTRTLVASELSSLNLNLLIRATWDLMGRTCHGRPWQTGAPHGKLL